MAEKIVVNFRQSQRISADLTTPQYTVGFDTQIKVVPPIQHSELLCLDYESSGHTGFASQEFVENNTVPNRLSHLPFTTGFRQGGSIYVDNGQSGVRMSMTALKDLNTKIVVIDNLQNVDYDKLTVNDFIYEEIQ